MVSMGKPAWYGLLQSYQHGIYILIFHDKEPVRHARLWSLMHQQRKEPRASSISTKCDKKLVPPRIERATTQESSPPCCAPPSLAPDRTSVNSFLASRNGFDR